MSEDNYMGRMPYTSATWRRCRIWLRTESTPRCVEADVIGACAVHVAPYSVDGAAVFSVTHIPTGLQIRGYGDKRNAARVAEALASVAGELNTARRVVSGVIGE